MTIKAKLIEKINSIDNETHLEALLNYLEDANKAPVQLTNRDIISISKSTKQLETGKFLNQDQLNNKIEKWLKK